MELKQYCFVLSQLVRRDIKRKYTRSKLGIIWSVLNPLLMMTVVSIIFSTMFERNIENYPLYYMTGLMIWSMFTGATNTSMEAIVDNKQMLVKVKLPKWIFPLSKVMTAFVNMMYTFIAYIILLIVFKISPSLTMICLPPIFILLLLFSLGISFIVSIIYVYFADFKYLYSVFLRLLMFMSALFYPVERLNGFAYEIVNANPIYWYISSARNTILYGEWISIDKWIKMCILSIIMFVTGIIFFKMNENKIMQKL